MLGILISAAVLCAAPDDTELIENLKSNWESQRAAVATAHIRARVFRGGKMEPLSHDEIDALFKSVNLAKNPDDLRTVVPRISKHKKFSTPEPWSMIEVTIDGDRLRERATRSEGATDDSVVDQGITVRGQAVAKQSSILRTADSKWNFYGLEDFRFIPILNETATVVRRDGDRVVIRGDSVPSPVEMEADEATGFVHACRFFWPDGSISQEILQFGPVSYPGDVLLPTAIAKFQYALGKIKRATVAVIEKADVNVDLPKDAFAVKAPKGTLIADAREPTHQRRFHAAKDVDDLVAAFPLDSKPSSPPSPERSTLAYLIVGGLVIGLLLLVFFYPRQKKVR